MPSQIWHQKKSQHDLDAYHHIETRKDEFIDWESVTPFYSALHLVDEQLATRNIHPRNHSTRNTYVRLQLKTLRQPYAFLYHLARKARYEVDISQLERDRAIVHLKTINSLLGRPVP